MNYYSYKIRYLVTTSSGKTHYCDIKLERTKEPTVRAVLVEIHRGNMVISDAEVAIRVGQIESIKIIKIIKEEVKDE